MDNDQNQPTQPDEPPDSEAGVEQCPICNRNLNPGACESCGHYFASKWDGEFIWNDCYTEYEEAWLSLVNTIWSLEQAAGRPALNRAKKTAKALGIPADWLEETEEEASAQGYLEKHFEFQYGETTATDGMLSGEGYSIYHEDPATVEDFMSRVTKFSKALNELIET